ncbi:MAG: class F sortase [Candidatus Saccharimonadales bacterium]
MAPDDSATKNSARTGSLSGHQSRPIVYGRQPAEVPNISEPQKFASVPAAPAISPAAKIVTDAAQPEARRRLKSGGNDDKDKTLLKHNKLTFTLTTMAVVAFAVGLGLAISNLWLNNKTNNHVAALSRQASKSADVPSENKPSNEDLNNYSVAPDMPRLLEITKIKLKSRVRPVGVKADNSLMAPDNIFDVGWYNGSAKPGQAGAAVIDGHVHGPTKPGVFIDLNQLDSGDKIQIERGDHKIIHYIVVKTKVYDISSIDMAAVMSSIAPGQNGLNLITCTGSIDSRTDSYTQRLVVFAMQQP